MGYNSLNYFLNKNYYNKSNIIGYFDFEDPQKSGVSMLSGNYFNNDDYLLLNIDNPNIFWSKSGTSTFNGNSFYKLSGNLLNNFYGAVAFNDIQNNKENIIFSSLNNSGGSFSGFNFGININGYPYIKYYDNNLGETYFSHSEKINSNKAGMLFFGINNEKFFIGSYSYEDKIVLEESIGWNINWERSNDKYIGGGANINSSHLFSGHIDTICFHENGVGQNIDKEIIVSGTVYDLVESSITGTISGQTGTLFGNIISVNICTIGVSGGNVTYSGLYTGTEYFVPTYTEFFDFNNESFSQYIYSGVSGTGYSSLLIPKNEIVICANTETGFEYYEYDSGYQIQYEIKNISTVLKKPEYLYYVYNGIQFNFELQSGDSIVIFYESPTGTFNKKSNFDIIKYNYVNNTYIIDSDINDISGIYYNGQLEAASKEYSEYQSGQYVNYTSSGDFTIVNNYIFSNNEFKPPSYSDNKFYSYLVADAWLKYGRKITIHTGLQSGQQLNGENFSNSIVFLNGQNLISGIDYELPNKFLINIPSGENNIFINNLDYFDKKIYYYNYINGNSIIYLNDNFVENSEVVWMNGVRMTKNIDYIEI